MQEAGAVLPAISVQNVSRGWWLFKFPPKDHDSRTEFQVRNVIWDRFDWNCLRRSEEIMDFDEWGVRLPAVPYRLSSKLKFSLNDLDYSRVRSGEGGPCWGHPRPIQVAVLDSGASSRT